MTQNEKVREVLGTWNFGGWIEKPRLNVTQLVESGKRKLWAGMNLQNQGYGGMVKNYGQGKNKC